MRGGRPLVWFHHMHKAGGTSVVELARANGMTLYPREANGNPLHESGEVIPLWEMPPDELRDWIHSCRDSGVNFVATEWGMPDMRVLKAMREVFTVVILRRPIDRFLSNFNYSSLYSFTDATDPRDYAARGPLFARPNYYTRMLSRTLDPEARVAQEHYEIAFTTLHRFDLCLTLEGARPFAPLSAQLGWTRTCARENRSKYPWRHKIKLFATGKWSAALRNLSGRRFEPDESFQAWFAAENVLDIRLYEEASQRRE